MTFRKPELDEAAATNAPEITILTKDHGTLSKTISIVDGNFVSDGSSCMMSSGSARRERLINGASSLAEAINALGPNEALALGRLVEKLPDEVIIRSNKKLTAGGPANIVARTKENIAYERGHPAFALIDIDLKGVPTRVAEAAALFGGYDELLTGIFPYLAKVGRVIRPSTSACVSNSETNEPCPDSGGQHIYPLVRDGADIERFLKVLHDRLWLAGYGWYVLGATGALLERSLVDRSVWGPERLVFEAPPTMISPAVQDAAARAPRIAGTIVLDTRTIVQDLSPVERAQADELKSVAREELKSASADLRSRSDRALAKQMSADGGAAFETCLRRIERRHAGELTAAIPLEFDDPSIGAATVGDILRYPNRFMDETLADPLEGVPYGRCKAKVMPGKDGWPFIHSFAHGCQCYDLRHDASSVRASLEGVAPESLCDEFIPLLQRSALADDELSTLCSMVAKRSGSGLLAVKSRVKAERQRLAAERKDALRAKAPDGRVVLDAPATDGEFTPVLLELDRIFSSGSIDPEPMRDVNGALVSLKEVPPDSLHLLTSADVNSGPVPLPAPPEPRIAPLNTAEATLLIERHVEYRRESVDGFRPVRLPQPFVDAYRSWPEGQLPIVRAMVTAPLVSLSGQLLMGAGLDRDSGIFYLIQPELRELIPTGPVDDEQTLRAWTFLAEEWLVDVATDLPGKAVAIAYALTLIERVLLPERPAFFFTASQRAAGKTTIVNMLVTAVTGQCASAAAWTEVIEERRKSLMSSMRAGVATIVWDNIRRGSLISCPHIEAILTSSIFSDRILGQTRTEEVSCQSVLAFTGNTIAPKGDLASRSLTVPLNVDRPDPENRIFRHSDPIRWTQAHRTEILKALYTLLLWPRPAAQPASPTRFKTWWALVGRPIESAVDLTGQSLSFGELFAAVEDNDEESDGTASAYRLLRSIFGPEAFTAAQVADLVKGYRIGDLASSEEFEREPGFADAIKSALVDASGSPFGPGSVTAQQIAKKMQRFVDRPAAIDGEIFQLRRTRDRQNGNRYELKAIPQAK